MTDPAVLKRQRGGHRSVATRRTKEVTDSLAALPGPDSIRLQQLKKGLYDTLDTLKRLDEDLMPHIDPGDIDKEIEDSERVKDELYAAIAKVEHALTSGHATPPVVAPPIASVHPTVTARLPKLVIKNFNGSITGWTPFWDSFQTSVHNNTTLSDAEKFSYLHSFLSGKALEAISGLSITDASYAIAIDILKKRFGDKEKTIAIHMDSLMNLEPVASDHYTIELRRLYDKTESSIGSLTALGVTVDSYGALLTPVFMAKLPSELRLTIARRVPQAEWKMMKIFEVFQEELEARERASLLKNKAKETPRRTREQPTARTFLGSSNIGCCYCGKDDHAPVYCKTIVSVDVRNRMLREQGRCFVCLRRGHIGRNCRSSIKFNVCKGRHNTSVCFRSKNERSSHSNSVPDVQDSSASQTQSRGLNPKTPSFEPTQTAATFLANDTSAIFLQTAQATAFNLEQPCKRMKLHLILDSGSQCSYITKNACKRLALRFLGSKSVSIMTFGSKKEQSASCEVVKLGLELKNSEHMELKLLVVPHICEPINNAAVALDKYPQLKSLSFASDIEHPSQIKPDILLGCDQYWSLVTGEVVKSELGPIAINTHLGWILTGPVAIREITAMHATLITHVLRVDGVSENKGLEKQLQSFWNLESLGIIESNESVQTQFESHISLENGRYVASLPWKECCLSLPTNYKLSLKRLHSLLKRLREAPELLVKYDAVIREQLSLGIVVMVPENEDTINRVHYIPHHAVIRRDKSTTKVRVVYDASAKLNGPSLNECLYSGPPLHCKIFDILIKFRTHPIALVADIEKAFLMIQVAESDQDALRFLWVKDIHAENPEVQTLKFTRVVFGVSPSPYILNATIAHHLKRFESMYSVTTQKIRESIYVDDVVTGADSVDEAFRFFRESKYIFKEGGFNLRKFVSNSRELQGLIDKSESSNNTTSEEKSYVQAIAGGGE